VNSALAGRPCIACRFGRPHTPATEKHDGLSREPESEVWARKNLPGHLPANEEAVPTWNPPRPPLPIPLFLSPRRWSLQLVEAHTGRAIFFYATPCPVCSKQLAASSEAFLRSPSWWWCPTQLTMGDSSSSASYIRMVCMCAISFLHMEASNDKLGYFNLLLCQVHHLIEKCICFNLNKEECMDALEKHANINPVITSTGML
jgi:hypothetical protein